MDKTLLDRFTFASGASRWVFRQPAPTRLNACAPCVQGFCPCVGEAGELWLDDSPRAQLFAQRFAEDLTDVWWAGDWNVLGKSGSVYVLAPSGAVKRARPPPSALQKTIRVGPRLFGAAAEGLVWSDDAGASWQRLKDGPAWPIDIAADPLGRVVVLTVPERLWQSTDGGSHFTPFPLSPNGTTALAVDGNQIRIASFLNGRAPLLTQSTDTTLPIDAPKLQHPTAEFLRASDMLEHRAAEAQERFIVVRHIDQRWVGYEGRIGQPLLGPWPLPELVCRRVQLEYAGRALLAICSNAEHADVAQALNVYVSSDGGHHFRPSPSRWFGIPKSLSAAPQHATEATLLSGICRPRQSEGVGDAVKASYRPGCRPSGVFRIAAVSQRDGETRLDAAPIDAAGLLGPALAIATHAKGPFAAMLARTTKSGALALFLSKDGGHSFDAHPLANRLDDVPTGFVKPSRAKAPDRGLTTASAASEPQPRFATASRATEPQLGIDSLRVDASGHVTLIVRYGDRPRALTFDSDATLLSSAFAPPGTSRMDAYENQLVALSVTRGALFESVDNGADFTPIADNLGPICNDAGGCGLVCQKAGCLVGERITRLGYRRAPATRIDVPSSAQAETTEQAKPTIRCRTSTAGSLTIEAAGPLPNAISAGFTDVAYYFLGLATADADVLVTEAKRYARTAASKRLFGGRHAERDTALAIQREAQGWAAVRVPHLGKPSDPIGTLEFAWSNLLRGKSGSGRDSAKETVSRLATDAATNGPRRFAPAQLSLQGDGLLFQWVPNSESQWLVPNAAPIPIHFDGWRSNSVHSTAWLADGEALVPVALAEQGMVLLHGSLDSPSVEAQTIAAYPMAAAAQPTEFAYLGQHAGVLTPLPLRSNEEVASSFRFFAIQPRSSPLVSEGRAIPRLISDGRRLPGCDQATRASSERLVIATGASDTMTLSNAGMPTQNTTLVTRRAVLYLGEHTACWDLLEAEDAATSSSALVFAEPQQPSWHFRTGRDNSGRNITELTPIDCTVE